MKLNTLLNYQLPTWNDTCIQFTYRLDPRPFGDLNNLGVLGRALRQDNTVIQIDVRNHGILP